MLRKLVLCLSVACLSQAGLLDSRAGEGRPPHMPGNGKKLFTPKDLAEEIQKSTSGIQSLQNNVNQLIGKVIKEDKEDGEWLDIMTHMAGFMTESMGWFLQAIEGTSKLTATMFIGDHGFEKITRCSNLAESIKSPDFGTDVFVPEMEVAMAKDLMCFSNMLNEVSAMKFRSKPGCPPTEGDVIDFISASFKDLFELRNDWERFYLTVNKVSEKYMTSGPDQEETDMTNMVRQLIRALGKN